MPGIWQSQASCGEKFPYADIESAEAVKKSDPGMNNDVKRILNYLNEKRGFDFSGYRTAMVERRVRQRFPFTKCKNCKNYFHYLQKNPDELNHLIDVLTINVSRFFRNTLTFEYIADQILPAIFYQKKENLDRSLRIWSAGCSMGEEPYSIAILINELFENEALMPDFNIFATDIDGKILKKAQKAAYPFESIQNVRYGLLKKYFFITEEWFQLIPEIKRLVLFSLYDILDKKCYVPPESIFGAFDMVFCRNVLIYFNMEYQNLIFDKLYRSLVRHGYLILGETEIPSAKYQSYFRRVNKCCHIYQKMG